MKQSIRGRIAAPLAVFSGGLAATLFCSTALAATIQNVHTHGSFETAGVIVTLTGDDGDESLLLEVKGPQDADFYQVHDFVRYDQHGFASSLFDLQLGTSYDLRITLFDPDGIVGTNPVTAQVRTRAEFSLPSPARVLYVSPGGRDTASAGFTRADPYATIGYALTQAQGGDEIKVLPGQYGAVSVSALRPAAESPIVVRADDATNRPVIDGSGAGTALNVQNSANLVFDGLEIRNGGGDGSGVGVRLNASAGIVVQNSYIHDNGRHNVLVTRGSSYPGGATSGGYHLIQDNVIADTAFTACSNSSNSACPGQTYYGIQQDNNPGAGTVVRRNTIYGHVDNTHVCGNEAEGRDLAENVNVLAITGGTWTNHNLDFYDNYLYASRDDHIELDGICVNARVFRNTFGNASNTAQDAQNAFSISPAMPGPYFVLRNLITGNWGEAAIKMNTGGNGSIPIRNIYFYHNTVARSNNGTLLNLWYAVPGDHNVPVKNIRFRNNVFWAKSGGNAMNCNNRGVEHPAFNYDLWYTTTTGNVFCWWDGSTTRTYSTFAQFQAGTGQELQGLFTDPGLGSDLRPSSIQSGVVDRGVRIPGINDRYAGSAPDLGAYEVGDPAFHGTPAPPQPPASGGGGGGGSGSGGNGSAASSSGGSGGGGCALGRGNALDPTLPLLLLASIVCLIRARVRSRS
jgi:hypothetical protein